MVRLGAVPRSALSGRFVPFPLSPVSPRILILAVSALGVAAGAPAASGSTAVASPAAAGSARQAPAQTPAERRHAQRRRARAQRRLRAARLLAAGRADPLSGALSSPAPASSAASARPFSPDSFWNMPLAAGAPLDVRSGAYVAALQRQLRTWVPYVNTTRYSTPVYEVDSRTPTVPVIFDNRQADLESVFARVPIPANARPAEGTDGHMVIWQRSTDTMWEMWRARKLPDGWRASYGGRITGLSRNPGYYTANPLWGATATSLPLLGGLMRLDELEAGEIRHALAVALPEVRAGVFSWPAQRSDGLTIAPDAIPAGTRFRIDPALDLTRIPMAPLVRTMAVAVQRYGMVVRDRAGAVTFFAEDPTPTGTNPFLGPDGLLGGQYITSLLQRDFPWSRLQALRTSLP